MQAEEDEVKLLCAVYEEAVVFPVKIARNVLASDLQYVIFHERGYRDKFPFLPDHMQLRLAWKKDAGWLQDNDLGDVLARKIDAAYITMEPSQRLFDDEGGYMKADFNPSGEEINVLVELPRQRVQIRWIYASLLIAVFCFLFSYAVPDLKGGSQPRYLFLLLSTGLGILVLVLISPASSIARLIEYCQGVLQGVPEPSRVGLNYPCEGIDGNILARDALTDKVIDLLSRRRVVFFRSPPMTGKTVFAALTSRVLARNRNNVVLRFSVVAESETIEFETWFELNCGVTYDEFMRWNAQGYTIYFVVDEAQMLFRKTGDPLPRRNSETFWGMVQEALTDTESNIRFLMFAAYGATPMYLVSTPANIPDDLILCIEHLNFTLNEIKAYVDTHFIGRGCLQGDAVSKFYSRLQLLTGNHVGLVVAAIDSLNESYDSCIKSGNVLPSAEVWIGLVEQGSVHQDVGPSAVFEMLNASRALKVVEELSSEDLAVLERFLYEDVDPLDDAIKNLISAGILVETVAGNIEFSSVVMWRYVIAKCVGYIERAVVLPSTLQDLVVRAISDINYDRVSKTLRTKMVTGIPLGKTWQMEFFLAAYRCTPSDTLVISAYAAAIFDFPGLIDFAVHCGNEFWGIEILQQNSNLDERNGRFATDGDYALLQLSGYCMIDFRLDSPGFEDLEKHANLFIVSYSTDMTNVQLRNRKRVWIVRA